MCYSRLDLTVTDKRPRCQESSSDAKIGSGGDRQDSSDSSSVLPREKSGGRSHLYHSSSMVTQDPASFSFTMCSAILALDNNFMTHE